VDKEPCALNLLSVLTHNSASALDFALNVYTLEVNSKANKPDDDEVYLRLQHGKGFHNLVYMSYVKHINPAKRHKYNITINTCLDNYLSVYVYIP
jgi:hypothetical protein